MALHLIMSASYNALLAIFLYILDKKTAFSKTPYKLKQVIFGVLFGLMAIFATTTFGGFDIGDGTIMNVRDAAHLWCSCRNYRRSYRRYLSFRGGVLRTCRNIYANSLLGINSSCGIYCGNTSEVYV